MVWSIVIGDEPGMFESVSTGTMPGNDARRRLGLAPVFALAAFLALAPWASARSADVEKSTSSASHLLLYSAFQRGDHIAVGRFWRARPFSDAMADSSLAAVFDSLCVIGDFDHGLKVASLLEARGVRIPVVHLLKAIYFIKIRDWQNARQSVDGSLQGPLTVAAYVTSAWILAASGFPDEAIDYLDRGGSPEIALLRDYTAALIAEKYGSRYEARRRWAEISKSPARNLALFESFAEFQARAGNRDGALKTVGLVKEVLPRHPKVEQLMRAISERRAQPDTMEDAADLLGKSLLLASGLIGGGNPVLSMQVAQLSKYLSRDGDVADLAVGEAAVAAKQYELARAQYESIAPQSSMFESARVQSAFLTYFTESPEAAEAALFHMVEQSPESIEALGALGDVLRSRKKWMDAIHIYDRAIGLVKPRFAADWVWLFNRAVAYDYSEDWPAARRDLEEALRLSPGNPQVQNYLAYSLIDRGEELEPSLTMSRAALQLTPDDGQFIDTLGWGYFRLGQLKEAEAAIATALKKMPGEPVIMEHLADIYWVTGRQTEALWLWRQSLSLKLEDRDFRRISEKINREVSAP